MASLADYMIDPRTKRLRAQFKPPPDVKRHFESKGADLLDSMRAAFGNPDGTLKPLGNLVQGEPGAGRGERRSKAKWPQAAMADSDPVKQLWQKKGAEILGDGSGKLAALPQQTASNSAMPERGGNGPLKYKNEGAPQPSGIADAHRMLDTPVAALVKQYAPDQASRVPDAIGNQSLRAVLQHPIYGSMVQQQLAPTLAPQLQKWGLTPQQFNQAITQPPPPQPAAPPASAPASAPAPAAAAPARAGPPRPPGNIPMPGASMAGVDPQLVAAVQGGAQYLPPGYSVRAVSGAEGRTNPRSHHSKGNAVDIQIIGPNGPIPHKGEDSTGLYTHLARGVKTWVTENNPELGSRIGYGGAFGTQLGGGGVPDLMHYDLGGSRGQMRPQVQYAVLKPLSAAERGAMPAGTPPTKAGDVVANALTGQGPGAGQAPAQRAITQAIAERPGPGLPGGMSVANPFGATAAIEQPYEGHATPDPAAGRSPNAEVSIQAFGQGATPGAPPPGWNRPPVQLTVNKVPPAAQTQAPATQAPGARQNAPAAGPGPAMGRSKLAQDIMDSWLPHPSGGELTTFREPATGNEIISGSIGGRDIYRNLGRTEGQPIQAPASLATSMADAVPMPRPRPTHPMEHPLPRPRPATDARMAGDPFMSHRGAPGVKSVDTLPVDLWRGTGQAPSLPGIGINPQPSFPGPQAPLPGPPGGIVPGTNPVDILNTPPSFPGPRGSPAVNPAAMIPSTSGPGALVSAPPAQAAPAAPMIPPALQWWQTPGAFGGGAFGGGGFGGGAWGMGGNMGGMGTFGSIGAGSWGGM